MHSVTVRIQTDIQTDRQTDRQTDIMIRVPVTLRSAKTLKLKYTLCLKKGTPTLSTVTLERINGF